MRFKQRDQFKASVLQSTLFKFFRKNDEKDKDTKKGH